jgi:hypothetical protein
MHQKLDGDERSAGVVKSLQAPARGVAAPPLWNLPKHHSCCLFQLQRSRGCIASTCIAPMHTPEQSRLSH